MSKIKKHKIEIFAEERSSDFVVDLRKGKKEIINTSLFSKEENKETNFEGNTMIFGSSIVSNNFAQKEKKNIGNKVFNKKKFEKILFYPLLMFIFKFFKKIYYFFFDWIVDIYVFLKKITLFKALFRLFVGIFGFFLFPFKRIFYFFKNSNFNYRIKFKWPKFKLKTKNKPLFDFIDQESKQLPLFKKSSPKKNIKSLIFFFLFLLLVALIFKGINYYNLYKKSNLQNELISLSLSGIQSFSSASEAISVFDFYQAYNKFSEAGENFESLDNELKKIDELVMFFSFFSDDKKIKVFSQSKNFSKIGVYLSSMGNNLSLSFNSLFLFFSEKNPKKDFNDFSEHITDSLSDLKKVNKYLDKIKVEAIPTDYQSDFIKTRKNLVSLENNLSIFVQYLPAIEDFLGINHDKRYLLVFQNNSEIRASGGFIGSYALIDIKNGKIINFEIPAGGSYDTEGGMKALVESPRPLHLVKNNWYFWDANWWPDWLLSAKNLMWFLEKSGGPSVDGVISFTPNVLGDLLTVFGSVDLSSKYGVIIDSNNFQDNLQEVVEVIGNPVLYQDQQLKTDILGKIKNNQIIVNDSIVTSTSSSSDNFIINNSYLEETSSTSTKNLFSSDLLSTTSSTTLNAFNQNKPKEIIGEVFDVLLDRVVSDIDKDKILKTFFLLLDNLDKKNILLYFENKKLQEMVEFYSWGGRLKKADNDYLMIVDTNIAGAKSDRFLKKNYYLQSEIKKDGTIINKLRIERDRRNEENSLFSGLRNVNWLRVYVPLGSKLISASGFASPDEKYFKTSNISLEKNSFLEKTENKAEIDLKSGLKIYQESGKTVFANWTMTDIGQLSTIEIEYELPGNIFMQERNISSLEKIFVAEENLFKHSLLWQKQAGAENSNFYFSWANNTSLNTVWFSDQIQKEKNTFSRSGELDLDKYFTIILK